VISQATGFIPLFIAFAIVDDTSARADALYWGGAGGFAGGAGVGMLYHGLAVGRMSVVAPVTGVVAAALPVVFGIVVGERPSSVAIVGVVCALAAVVLISGAGFGRAAQSSQRGIANPTGIASVPGLLPALGAGACFGLFFILLERAGDDAGLWPIVASRMTATLLFLVAAVVSKTSVLVDLKSAATIAVVGLLDVSAITLYVYATRHGLLSLVAVLASMYPAMTVLLARTVLKERFVFSQRIGLILAGAGVALIALG
jgi:drug/metabolite transporter (DMT)-like permease